MRLAKLILSALTGMTVWAVPVTPATVKIEKTKREISLHVIPPKDTHLNFEASWRLSLQGRLPLQDSKSTYGMESVDRKFGGFKLPLARPLTASEKAEYTLTYFYCSNDNSWCKRAQSKGEL